MSSTPATPGHDRRPLEQMSEEELRQEYVHMKVMQFQLELEARQLKTKIEHLRGESVRLQQNAEVEEEHAANQLFRRLDGAERDVRKYQVLLKEEEESTSKLRQQIREVRSQQTEVENQLEEQEEYLLLQLQKKLLEVASNKSQLERKLQVERQQYLDVLVNQLAVLRGGVGEGDDGSSGDSGPAAVTPAGEAKRQQQPQEPSSQAGGKGRVASSPGSPGSPTDAAAHEKIVLLEQHLNKLLGQHAKAMQESAETERRCAELSNKLTNIQNATFLDRARAAKLKEELNEARSKLSDLESNTADGSSSLDESGSFSTSCRSLEQSIHSANPSQSLKERTKELLSAALPPSAPQ